MKNVFLYLLLLVCGISSAQDGHEIKVTFKPFKNQYIYLGHYFGKTYPIIDSALLNDKSEAVFKGSKTLPGGIYLIGYPKKTGFFEILIDKKQHFGIIADTASLKEGIQFVNSPDNILFASYQKQMSERGKTIAFVQQQLRIARNKEDSLKLIDELTKMDKSINEYRRELGEKNPQSILTAFLATMREPQLSGKLKEPKTREDSLAAYNYYKSHYWDDVNFWDGRLSYTPFFEDKIDKYFSQLVSPHPDSTIMELDKMLGPASINEEMTRFLLVKFINRYLNQKYMWEDAVFVHLFEKYFAQKNYPWFNEQARKIVTDRAYSLMANILGTPASDIELPDSTGTLQQLYSIAAPYTLVVFWDVTCGHCKEVLPELDSFYREKWNASGLKIFAVSKETDGNTTDWKKFISSQKLFGWTHVYYSKLADKARTDNQVPGYSQLYDVLSFPTLYLLDKDKRIIAKKLSYQQIDEVLQLKLKGE